MTTAPFQGRLFRKYVVVLLVLVGGVLMVSSLVELYFSYRATQQAIVRVERANAVAAASRIEQFLKEVAEQVRETTRTASDDPTAGRPGRGALGFREGLAVAIAAQRELDFLRVLRSVPAIGELRHIDVSGKEQLRVSRLQPDVVDSQEDLSRTPAFVAARTGKVYWSPVYLKNESEPYMILAMPVGQYAVEVTTAEVSLRTVLKVISRIEVGPGGYAYVVDARNHLVAHPDSRVLRERRDLSALVQVTSARTDRSVMVADGLGGGRVLAAHAPIAPLGWLVFVERPAAAAYAPLREPIIRSVVIFVLGLGLSILSSIFLARRMVAPIRALQTGAARIGAGDLGHRVEVRTGDELEALGDELNRTAVELEAARATLEHKVEERTRELAETNTELTRALEQQTATSEVLKLISRSALDLPTVLQTLIENATRLCGATRGHIFRFDGELLRFAAAYGATPEFVEFLEHTPIRPGPESVAGRAAVARRTVHVHDVLAEPGYQYRDLQSLQDYRTVLAVPVLREDVLLAVVTILKTRVEPFTPNNIELITTFADQAGIAIENARLIQQLHARTGELARSVEELRALGEVGQAVSSTLDLETVLNTIVARAVQLSNANGGVLYEYDEVTQEFSRIRGAHGLDTDLLAVLSATPLRLGEGVAGKAAARQAPVQVADVLVEGTYDVARTRAIFERRGYRSLLAVPLLFEQRIVGVLAVWGREPGSFAQEIVDLLQTLATQSGLAIQNARLFREIADKSQQLEAASQHKSEFLANMSHELRTPLNAVIGFSEVLAEGMFGDLNDKQAEYLQDILESGRHLLSLINDILDLSKIEAGRMELERTDFDLPSAIDNALVLMRERAGRKDIAVGRAVDERLGVIRADERKVKQVLLNLLSNALKFTPEGGRIDVRAGVRDGMAELSVTDTGVGIAAEDQPAVFEEFRQVGASAKRVEGTGLGLALSRKFVELHGGTIWVASEVGKGSTFTFTIPLRPED
jgi:signal transduction histidine kinase/HAMP domain-containing protein